MTFEIWFDKPQGHEQPIMMAFHACIHYFIQNGLKLFQSMNNLTKMNVRTNT